MVLVTPESLTYDTASIATLDLPVAINMQNSRIRRVLACFACGA